MRQWSRERAYTFISEANHRKKAREGIRDGRQGRLYVHISLKTVVCTHDTAFFSHFAP